MDTDEQDQLYQNQRVAAIKGGVDNMRPVSVIVLYGTI